MKILEIDKVNKHFDGIIALDDFSCYLKKGEILGLIGPNGAGKSTLFNVITGFISCDSGQIFFNEKNISNKSSDRIVLSGISRTFQELRLITQMTVLENVMLAFREQPGEKLTTVFLKNKKSRQVEKDNKKEALSLLEYSGILDKANDLASDLSYGQQKLLSIVCCLASDAELILLDEPVAGLNPIMIEKILSIIIELPKKRKSIIIIEHNMDVVMQICNRVIFMNEGKKISEGLPENVRKDPEVIRAYLE